MTTDDKNAPPAPGGFPFSPQDAMAFMQRMWNPLGVPIPGFGMPQAGMPGAAVAPGVAAWPSPPTMFPALDPAEIDRKIAELRIIENWLTMSVSMMQMSIKTMELQKASLEAMRGAQAPSRRDAGHK
jgi:hypothetical protein